MAGLVDTIMSGMLFVRQKLAAEHAYIMRQHEEFRGWMQLRELRRQRRIKLAYEEANVAPPTEAPRQEQEPETEPEVQQANASGPSPKPTA